MKRNPGVAFMTVRITESAGPPYQGSPSESD